MRGCPSRKKSLFRFSLFSIAAALLLQSAWGAPPVPKSLEFIGQVVIPAKAIMRTRRISLIVLRVGSPLRKQVFADFHGRFRFHNLAPGAYHLSIHVPGYGDLDSTVDITPSFADSKGRVEKIFTYDDDALAHQAQPPTRGTVSVRQLSIPWKAQMEFDKGRNDLEQEKLDSSRKHFEKALEIAPQYTEAMNNLGILAFQARDFAAAEKYFREALEKDPDEFEPLVNLGGALLALERTDEAVEINRRAQEMRPTDPLAAAQLGMSYYLAGNDEEALNYLLLTEQLDPNHYTNPQIPLAKIYMSHSDTDGAIEELRDFLKRHPDSSEAGSVRETLNQLEQNSNSQRAAAAHP